LNVPLKETSVTTPKGKTTVLSRTLTSIFTSGILFGTLLPSITAITDIGFFNIEAIELAADVVA
jgi:hypothetical protein